MYNYKISEWENDEYLMSEIKYESEEFEIMVNRLYCDWDEILKSENELDIWYDRDINYNMEYIKWKLVNEYGFKSLPVEASYWID